MCSSLFHGTLFLKRCALVRAARSMKELHDTADGQVDLAKSYGLEEVRLQGKLDNTLTGLEEEEVKATAEVDALQEAFGEQSGTSDPRGMLVSANFGRLILCCIEADFLQLNSKY